MGFCSGRLLFAQFLRRTRRRIGVGHFEHGCRATHGGRSGTGAPIFLMRIARLTEMHMHVNRARQDVFAGNIHGFARGRHGFGRPYRQDQPILDRNIGAEARP